MSFLTRPKLPTQESINDQFTHGNIHKSLAYYNKIKRQNGDYQFGDLTVQWYGANPDWMNDLNAAYGAPAQQQIMGYVVGFLTNQTNGKPDPTPFTIVWSDGPKSISQTANTIEIVGYSMPPTAAERKKKNP
jgi:hypothetical protein